jgi:hypothetical protein
MSDIKINKDDALKMLEGAENILSDSKNVSSYDQSYILRAIITALKLLLEK